MHFYEDHLYGSIYYEEHKLSYDDLYCEECGDNDCYIGEANGPDDLRDLLQQYWQSDDEDVNQRIEDIVSQVFSEYNQVPTFPRNPSVPNKYKLTPEKIRHLKVLDVAATHRKPFHMNPNYPEEPAVCGGIWEEGYEDAWWYLRVNDEGVVAFTVTVMELCKYEFEEFYNFDEIDNEIDLRIQEMILERLNQLIDDGVLGLPD